MTRRQFATATPFAALLLLALAGPVLAECFPPPPDFPRIRYAFTATVTEFSDSVAEDLPDMSGFDWHLEMSIDRTYRGDLPGRLEADGWEYGCGFTGVEVRVGERLFVAAEKVELSDPRLVLGEVLIWRGVGEGRWEFYADALQDGALGYPTAAVRADTTDEILGVLSDLRPPDTSTAPAKDADRRDPPLPLLAALLVVTFLTFVVRPQVRSRTG